MLHLWVKHDSKNKESHKWNVCTKMSWTQASTKMTAGCVDSLIVYWTHCNVTRMSIQSILLQSKLKISHHFCLEYYAPKSFNVKVIWRLEKDCFWEKIALKGEKSYRWILVYLKSTVYEAKMTGKDHCLAKWFSGFVYRSSKGEKESLSNEQLMSQTKHVKV